MTENAPHPGDFMRLDLEIHNSEGVAGDPGELTFWMNAPDDSVTSYIWTQDDELVRDGVGSFHVDWPIVSAGRHRYAWESTGVNAGWQEGMFDALARSVVTT